MYSHLVTAGRRAASNNTLLRQPPAQHWPVALDHHCIISWSYILEYSVKLIANWLGRKPVPLLYLLTTMNVYFFEFFVVIQKIYIYIIIIIYVTISRQLVETKIQYIKIDTYYYWYWLLNLANLYIIVIQLITVTND